MGTKEIFSPQQEVSPKCPRALVQTASFGYQKLSLYFVEPNDRRTAFSRSYTSRTTPVNLQGKPIADLPRTGGWITALFIFRNKMTERMAYFDLSMNIVAFMFYVMHRPFSSSSKAVNNFLGISQALPVLGGFLADAYCRATTKQSCYWDHQKSNACHGEN